MTIPVVGLTSKVSVIADYWHTELDSAKGDLGLQAVYFGDQSKIPLNPAICVDPGEKSNNLKTSAASRKLDPNILVSIMIYHSAVSSPQDNARQSIILAEEIEDFIHERRTAEGLVIHCHVTSIEPGYIERSGTLMRATRLTIEHITQTILPS